MATLAGRRIHHVHALHEQYGSYVRISPNEVAVVDPAGFKQIHALGNGFNKTQWYTDMVFMARQGVFSMPGGKPHADRRRLLSRPFSKSHLRQTWETTIRGHVCLAVEKVIQEARHPNTVDGKIDLLKWWTFMASDVSAHLMFGESFHTLESGVVSDYIRVLQKTLQGGGVGAELPLVRAVCRRIPSPLFKEMFDGNAFLMNYGKAAVTNMKATGGGGNIFANMMNEAEKGERLDELDVQVEATNLIVAGTDTTAITLTYLIWAVLSRPGLRGQLVTEVLSLSEGYSDGHLEALPLLNGVIEETLRLYGAAPGGLPRSVPAGGVEVGGFHFPGGTTLTTQAFSLHRDPNIFPYPNRYVYITITALANLAMLPDSQLYSFEPRRFIKGSDLYISDAAKAVYSPFGAGSRTCLGVHLAYMELRYGAAEFFRRCPNASLASDTTDASMELENYFLVAPVTHRCNIVINETRNQMKV